MYLRWAPTRRNALWEGDHTELPVLVMAPRAQRARRPWATLFIDELTEDDRRFTKQPDGPGYRDVHTNGLPPVPPAWPAEWRRSRSSSTRTGGWWAGARLAHRFVNEGASGPRR